MAVKKAASVIPQRAVTEVQGKYRVAVVSAENKVTIKQVKVGERFGQLWVIEEGLTPGEKVVAEGIQKVREGMGVTAKPFEPQPETKPEAEKRPESEPAAQSKSKKR